MSSKEKEVPRNRVLLEGQDSDPLVSSKKTFNVARPLDLGRRIYRGQAQQNADPGHLQQPVKPSLLTAFQTTRRATKGSGGPSHCAEPYNILTVRKSEARLLLGSIGISKALRWWTVTLTETADSSGA